MRQIKNNSLQLNIKNLIKNFSYINNRIKEDKTNNTFDFSINGLTDIQAIYLFLFDKDIVGEYDFVSKNKYVPLRVKEELLKNISDKENLYKLLIGFYNENNLESDIKIAITKEIINQNQKIDLLRLTEIFNDSPKELYLAIIQSELSLKDTLEALYFINKIDNKFSIEDEFNSLLYGKCKMTHNMNDIDLLEIYFKLKNISFDKESMSHIIRNTIKYDNFLPSFLKEFINNNNHEYERNITYIFEKILLNSNNIDRIDLYFNELTDEEKNGLSIPIKIRLMEYGLINDDFYKDLTPKDIIYSYWHSKFSIYDLNNTRLQELLSETLLLDVKNVFSKITQKDFDNMFFKDIYKTNDLIKVKLIENLYSNMFSEINNPHFHSSNFDYNQLDESKLKDNITNITSLPGFSAVDFINTMISKKHKIDIYLIDNMLNNLSMEKKDLECILDVMRNNGLVFSNFILNKIVTHPSFDSSLYEKLEKTLENTNQIVISKNKNEFELLKNYSEFKKIEKKDSFSDSFVSADTKIKSYLLFDKNFTKAASLYNEIVTNLKNQQLSENKGIEKLLGSSFKADSIFSVYNRGSRIDIEPNYLFNTISNKTLLEEDYILLYSLTSKFDLDRFDYFNMYENEKRNDFFLFMYIAKEIEANQKIDLEYLFKFMPILMKINLHDLFTISNFIQKYETQEEKVKILNKMIPYINDDLLKNLVLLNITDIQTIDKDYAFKLDVIKSRIENSLEDFNF